MTETDLSSTDSVCVLLTPSSVLAASSPGQGVESCSFSNTSYTHTLAVELIRHALRQQHTLLVICESARQQWSPNATTPYRHPFSG